MTCVSALLTGELLSMLQLRRRLCVCTVLHLNKYGGRGKQCCPLHGQLPICPLIRFRLRLNTRKPIARGQAACEYRVRPQSHLQRNEIRGEAVVVSCLLEGCRKKDAGPLGRHGGVTPSVNGIAVLQG